MQSVLPEHMIRVTIGDLVLGEEAYILPWSIAVDSQGQMWVRTDHEFSPIRFGTSRVRITRRSGYFSVYSNTTGAITTAGSGLAYSPRLCWSKRCEMA